MGVQDTPSLYAYPQGIREGKLVELENPSDHYTPELLLQEMNLPGEAISHTMDSDSVSDGEAPDEDEGNDGDNNGMDSADDDRDNDRRYMDVARNGTDNDIEDGGAANVFEKRSADDENGPESDDSDDKNDDVEGDEDEDEDNGNADDYLQQNHHQLTGTEGRLPGPGWVPGPQGLPQLGGGAVQRRHDAGHAKARNQPKSIDRFKFEIQARQDDYVRKRKGFGRLVRHDNRKDTRGQWKQKQDVHVMTKGMKFATPGTLEYATRDKVFKKRASKAQKRMRGTSTVALSNPLLKETLPWKKDVRKASWAKSAASGVPLVGRHFKMTPEEELILDVSVTFVTGLETSIKFPGSGELNQKQKDALLKYLDLLSIALPPEWGIHRLIGSLRDQFAIVTKGRAYLQKVLDKHPLPRKTWSRSCVNKERELSGYSCGLWKLLHVVTVGVAEQRGGLNLIESGMISVDANVFSPIDAADAIRDYIEEFFNCATCKRNFVQTYDDCDNNRRCDRLTEKIEDASIADWKELPIWMWEVHNEVSIRLQKERAGRAANRGISTLRRSSEKSEIAVIWPNIDECFLCFNNDGTWDEAEVFKHLESAYWPDSELDPKSELLIQYDGDRSVGLLMWLAMFGILWIIYMVVVTTSPATLHQSIYQAKRMVKKGSSKKRSL